MQCCPTQENDLMCSVDITSPRYGMLDHKDFWEHNPKEGNTFPRSQHFTNPIQWSLIQENHAPVGIMYHSCDNLHSESCDVSNESKHCGFHGGFIILQDSLQKFIWILKERNFCTYISSCKLLKFSNTAEQLRAYKTWLFFILGLIQNQAEC